MVSETEKSPRYRVQFLPSAASELARLPAKERAAIVRAIDALQRDPTPPGHIVLNGYDQPEDQPPICRVVVGEYRVIYRIKDKFLLVIVLKIGPRRADRVCLEFARQMGRGSPPRRRGGR